MNNNALAQKQQGIAMAQFQINFTLYQSTFLDQIIEPLDEKLET